MKYMPRPQIGAIGKMQHLHVAAFQIYPWKVNDLKTLEFI